jgi:hypothetical protein
MQGRGCTTELLLECSGPIKEINTAYGSTSASHPLGGSLEHMAANSSNRVSPLRSEGKYRRTKQHSTEQDDTETKRTAQLKHRLRRAVRNGVMWGDDHGRLSVWPPPRTLATRHRVVRTEHSRLGDEIAALTRRYPDRDPKEEMVAKRSTSAPHPPGQTSQQTEALFATAARCGRRRRSLRRTTEQNAEHRTDRWGVWSDTGDEGPRRPTTATNCPDKR